MLYTQTRGQEQAGASQAAQPPVALSNSQSGHLSPQGYCSLCLLEHFTLASVFLLGFKAPRGFGEGSPEFTIYLFLRHTEITHPAPQSSGQSQRKPTPLFPSFPLRTPASSLRVFTLSPSAFNFLCSLTSVFSAFFSSLLVSLRLPSPPPDLSGFLEHALQILSGSRITIFAQRHSDHSGLFASSSPHPLLHSFLSRPSTFTSYNLGRSSDWECLRVEPQR